MPSKVQSKWIDLTGQFIFTGDVRVPSPSLSGHATSKGYVDTIANSVATLVVDDILYTDSVNKVIPLSNTVANYAQVSVSVIGGTMLDYGDDYTVRFVGTQAYICIDPSSTSPSTPFNGGDGSNPTVGFNALIANTDEVKVIYSSAGPGGAAAGFQGPVGMGVQGVAGFQGPAGGPQGTMGESGVQGRMGPMGPFGGPQGATGLQGVSSAPTIQSVVNSNSSVNQADSPTFTTLNFNNDLVSFGGDISHDPSGTSTPSSNFIINASGAYEIAYHLSDSSASQVEAQVLRNGTPIAQSFASSASFNSVNNVFAAQFVLNDIITVQARYVSGPSGNWIGNQTQFMIHRLVGVKGDSGVQGYMGVQGVPGITAFGGPQGSVGPVGPGGSGPQGFTGFTGATGGAGVQGKTGFQGPIALNPGISANSSGTSVDAWTNVYSFNSVGGIATITAEILNTDPTNILGFQARGTLPDGSAGLTFTNTANPADKLNIGGSELSSHNGDALQSFYFDVQSNTPGQPATYDLHIRGVEVNAAGPQGNSGAQGFQGPIADGSGITATNSTPVPSQNIYADIPFDTNQLVFGTDFTHPTGAGNTDITINNPGNYFISYYLTLESGGTTLARVRKNNSIVLAGSIFDSTLSSASIPAQKDFIAQLNAGDFITLQASDSGSDNYTEVGITVIRIAVGVGPVGPQGSSGNFGLVGELCVQSGGDSNAGGFNTSALGFQSFAVGFQTSASGINSFAEGQNTTASGTASHTEGINTNASASGAHAEGQNTFANGVNAHAEGQSTTASGTASHAQGMNSLARLQMQHALSSGKFTNQGDAQSTEVIARNTTTDATPTSLFVDGSTVRIDIANNTTYGYSAKVIARQTGGTSACAYFEVSGFITRDSGVGTTRIITGSSNITSDASAAAWTLVPTADNTNGQLVFTATGEAAKNIQWVAHIRLVETFE